ncbi:putative nuclease HARBI1 [Argopecten irradians]|uniref:putative nuclease HARBI1 n=1 Tax=Argopecten irradians TaxID=31199 RepID=UPI00371A6CB2
MAAMNVMFDVLGKQRIQRVHRDFGELDSLNDSQIRARYRFSRENIVYIADLIRERVERPTKRSNALSVEMQVLIALRFYASGSFQQVLGDAICADKSTVSRVVRDVSNALASLESVFIKWPTTRAKKEKIRSAFYQQGGFPGVIGCIDGTQIRIQAPSEDEPSFVNRKGYHSINVQAICDDEGKFTNIVARWPGSAHDSHVFRMSNIKQYLDANHRTMADGLILGDSGYACLKYLMTPYLRPTSAQQERFNGCHKRTRVMIERTFGVWKRRFHVLHGEIRMKPTRVCAIIGACAVLHNLAIMLREPEMDADGEIETDDIQNNALYNGHQDGQSVRRHITATYFG